MTGLSFDERASPFRQTSFSPGVIYRAMPSIDTLLAAHAPGPAWKIGAPKDEPLYDGLNLTFAGPSEAAFISCTGLVDDMTETPEDYRAALSIAAERGLPMVCANPDLKVHVGEQLIWCAGGLADLYQQLGGGPVTMAGKPYPAIYDLALNAARGLAGPALDSRRILCVGDGAPTDLAGANAQGLDALFVAGGLHGEHVLDALGRLDPAGLSGWLDAQGVTATKPYALSPKGISRPSVMPSVILTPCISTKPSLPPRRSRPASPTAC